LLNTKVLFYCLAIRKLEKGKKDVEDFVDKFYLPCAICRILRKFPKWLFDDVYISNILISSVLFED
jgi:hypothetical protein